MSDIKELKEKDLTDEVLEKVTGGIDLPNLVLTCPVCGSPDVEGWLDYETQKIIDITCRSCGLGMGSKHQ